MNGPRPQSTANDLLDRLEGLFNLDTVPESSVLAKLRHEASALDKVNPSDGALVKAGIAVLEWDIPTIHKQVEIALSQSPDAITLMNCAVTLKTVNLISSAADLALQGVAISNGSISNVYRALSLLMSAGRIRECVELAQKHPQINETIETLLLIQAQISKLAIKEDRLEREVANALSVLSNNKIRHRHFDIYVVPDPDGSESAVFWLSFNGDIEREFDLEKELVALQNEDANWDPAVLSVEFRHIDKLLASKSESTPSAAEALDIQLSSTVVNKSSFIYANVV